MSTEPTPITFDSPAKNTAMHMPLRGRRWVWRGDDVSDHDPRLTCAGCTVRGWEGGHAEFCEEIPSHPNTTHDFDWPASADNFPQDAAFAQEWRRINAAVNSARIAPSPLHEEP